MYNNQKENSNFTDVIGKNSQPGNSSSNELEIRVENILAVIDIEVEIPDGIVEKVMQKKEMVKIDTPNDFDFFKYLQIAAVLAAGIFLGVLLGKNADIHSFNKKQMREDRAFLELREKHHINEDYAFGRL